MDTDGHGWGGAGRKVFGASTGTAAVWSAVTCPRFCAGDWSPWEFGAAPVALARWRWREP